MQSYRLACLCTCVVWGCMVLPTRRPVLRTGSWGDSRHYSQVAESVSPAERSRFYCFVRDSVPDLKNTVKMKNKSTQDPAETGAALMV